MVKYRSRNQILAEMLRCASSGPIVRTRVMFEARLSYYQLKEHMAYLIDNGFMLMASGKVQTSPAGIDLMRKLEKAERVLAAAQEVPAN